jgi:lysophospholipase L1-like esterase
VPELNLSDGIHPNASGQVIVAQTVVDFLMSGDFLK